MRVSLGWLGPWAMACGDVVPPEGAPEALAPPPSLCVPGEVVACEALAATWVAGDATCTGRGYDVSSCDVDPDPARGTEVAIPAARDAARWGDALTNNGDLWWIEVDLSPTSSPVWVLRLGGGGFCDDDVATCEERSFLAKGKDLDDDGTFVDRRQDKGIADRDPATNPLFWDANHVVFPYRSSDLWLGGSLDATDTSCTTADCVLPSSVLPCGTLPNGKACTGQWVRRGRFNVRAGLELLIQRYGLDDVDAEVLFMGTSAGAYGVQHNADTLVAVLPTAAAAGRLKIAADGAWAAAWDDPTFRIGDEHSTADGSDFEVLAASLGDRLGGRPNTACARGERAHGGSARDCIGSKLNHRYLVDPPALGGLGLEVFVQKSEADTIEWALHRDAADVSLGGATGAVADAAREAWRLAQREALSEVTHVVSCEVPGHTTFYSDRWWTQVVREPLSAFWLGLPPAPVNCP